MGFFDRFKPKPKYDLDDVKMPPKVGGMDSGLPAAEPFGTSGPLGAGMKAQMDLILSHMESLRIQYEAINARLQNLERTVNEIRSFCK
jgi:hypothetical protein